MVTGSIYELAALGIDLPRMIFIPSRLMQCWPALPPCWLRQPIWPSSTWIGARIVPTLKDVAYALLNLL